MDQLEKNLNRIHEWIRAVDQKISIFFAFQGIILTILISNSNVIFNKNFVEFSCNNTKILFGIIGIIILIFSCYKSIMVLFSRIKIDNHQKSFLYFGDIAKMTLNEFKNILQKTTPEDYEKEYINQIYISAKIAKNKHVLFREAVITFMISIFILIIYFLI